MCIVKTYFLGLAASVLGLASTQTASAQWNKNFVGNSGNGIGNKIVVGNQPGFNPFGGFGKNFVNNSGNGIGNQVIVGNGGGFPGFPGGSFGGSFPGGGVFPGGININTVVNSGNGVGNRVIVGNK